DLELDIQQISLNGSKEQRKQLPALKDQRIKLARREAAEVEALRQSELALQRVKQHGTQIDDEVAFFQKEINDRRSHAESINKDLIKSEEDLARARGEIVENDEKILRLQEDLERSNR